ncbi:MAG TPA: hypothetical protein VFE93_03030 [Myxococcaceae bacterium]|nr:hypothetical protein [Myxococcaceae bacterium]
MSEQNAENADKTKSETTDTNAGSDAVMGTVAEQEPTDSGEQKPMDDFGPTDEVTPQKE